LRLRKNFGDTLSASLTHNTRNNATAITASRDPLRSMNRTYAQMRGEFRNGVEDDFLVSADVEYEGNRFTAYGYHFEDRTLGGRDFSRDSFVQFNTSLAFADGKAAVGRQSYSGGFAIVNKFKGNPEEPVYVDDWGDGEYSARSGALGPALVIDLTPYINQRIDVSTRSEQDETAIVAEEETTTEDAVEEIIVPDEFEQVLIYALPFGGSVITPDLDKQPEQDNQ
jgi:outer membrane usher protein FimD/PapC